jgi:hypothetical protein
VGSMNMCHMSNILSNIYQTGRAVSCGVHFGAGRPSETERCVNGSGWEAQPHLVFTQPQMLKIFIFKIDILLRVLSSGM